MITPNEFTKLVKGCAELALKPLAMRVEFRDADAWRFGAHGHIAHFIAYKNDAQPSDVLAEGMINVRDHEAKAGGANFLALFVVQKALEGCVTVHHARMGSIAFHWEKIETLIGITPKPATETPVNKHESRRRKNKLPR